VSVPTNHDLAHRRYLAVQFQCVVQYLDIECLFVSVEFKVFRHSPRVPAGTVSPEGHDALSHLFTVGSCDDHLGIERVEFLMG